MALVLYKCAEVIFSGNPRSLASLILKPDNKAKDHGLMIDSKLTCTKHVKKRVKNR